MRSAIETKLHNIWSRRGLAASLLYPLSLVYLCLARSRSKKITPVELPVPVVVVGNIYVGGTGKTPITIALVRELCAAGFTPGIISRGYGRAAADIQLVTPESDAALVGDEPLLIAQSCEVPVAVGRDRIAAAHALLQAHPEVNVIVSDDGLQHKRLARDVELAVIGARGLGNGWALPAGPLREMPSRLNTVDAIILNATDEQLTSRTPRFAATSQMGDAVRIANGQRRSLDDLAHRIAEKEAHVLAAAGIAAPERFFCMLNAHDIQAVTMPLGDHYDYAENPFKGHPARYIFVTGKDAVKIRQNPEMSQDRRIWAVDLEMQLDPYLIEFVIEKVHEAAERKNLDVVPISKSVTH